MADLAKVIHGIDEPEQRVLRSELIRAIQAFVEAEEAWRRDTGLEGFDDPLADAYDNAKAVLERVHASKHGVVGPPRVLKLLAVSVRDSRGGFGCIGVAKTDNGVAAIANRWIEENDPDEQAEFDVSAIEFDPEAAS